MRFVSGMLVGSLVTMGATAMYNGMCSKNDTKKMMKKGKQFVKKMGII